MENQTQLTREEQIAQLKAAIEYQELTTKLQELITKQVVEKYNETMVVKKYQDEFGATSGPTPENIKEMQTEAELAIASQTTAKESK